MKLVCLRECNKLQKTPYQESLFHLQNATMKRHSLRTLTQLRLITSNRPVHIRVRWKRLVQPEDICARRQLLHVQQEVALSCAKLQEREVLMMLVDELEWR